jgi:hypothetical protein
LGLLGHWTGGVCGGGDDHGFRLYGDRGVRCDHGVGRDHGVYGLVLPHGRWERDNWRLRGSHELFLHHWHHDAWFLRVVVVVR